MIKYHTKFIISDNFSKVITEISNRFNLIKKVFATQAFIQYLPITKLFKINVYKIENDVYVNILNVDFNMLRKILDMPVVNNHTAIIPKDNVNTFYLEIDVMIDNLKKNDNLLKFVEDKNEIILKTEDITSKYKIMVKEKIKELQDKKSLLNNWFETYKEHMKNFKDCDIEPIDMAIKFDYNLIKYLTSEIEEGKLTEDESSDIFINMKLICKEISSIINKKYILKSNFNKLAGFLSLLHV